MSVKQPPSESVSPAPEKFRPVSEVSTEQLLYDSSDDRNETDLSSAASQFVTKLIGDYEAAKSHIGEGVDAVKSHVGLGMNDSIDKDEVDPSEQVTSSTQSFLNHQH